VGGIASNFKPWNPELQLDELGLVLKIADIAKANLLPILAD